MLGAVVILGFVVTAGMALVVVTLGVLVVGWWCFSTAMLARLRQQARKAALDDGHDDELQVQVISAATGDDDDDDDWWLLPEPPTFPPNRIDRPKTAGCLVLGCDFEDVRVDWCWIQRICRRCQTSDGARLEKDQMWSQR